jgi:hypothetical protein
MFNFGFLRNKCLIWIPFNRTLYLRQQGREDPWLFLRNLKGSASNKFWETLSQTVILLRSIPKEYLRFKSFKRYKVNTKISRNYTYEVSHSASTCNFFSVAVSKKQFLFLQKVSGVLLQTGVTLT